MPDFSFNGNAFSLNDTIDGLVNGVDNGGSPTEIYGDSLSGYAYEERPKSAVHSVSDIMSSLPDLGIDEFSTLDRLMAPYFFRLFDVTVQEHDITLGLTGMGAASGGDSDSITPALKQPAYADGYSYVDFVNNTKLNEKIGVVSTSYDNVTYSPYYNGGKIYGNTENLYPDDNGTGMFPNKWKTGDERESILWKTREMFRQHKIKTLISRFGSHADDGGDSTGYNGENADPRYGESHGRNLLTKDAEMNGGMYNINGYNNPYCRVWTHHYQYSKIADMIRPFDDISPDDFNKWENFKIDGTVLDEYNKNGEKVGTKAWGWKYNNEGWKRSVMDFETGLPKIAPKYQVGGGEANIHTKDCMFSIENLAWKDYDPYSFERALSWEQRGPMGGRIMWFPPYGITFNESIITKWNTNDFIGRGESVYSYANTQRSGTLSFLMVVDHPSVVDYALWGDEGDVASTMVKDTDLLRYFAGCDSSVVMEAARPTPLTDEYLDKGIKEKEANPSEVPSASNEPSNEDTTEEFNFKVFFPNNYTGVWDLNGVYTINPIQYLLHGKASNFKITGGNIVEADTNGLTPLLGNEDFVPEEGVGYEMGNYGISASSKTDYFEHDTVLYKFQQNLTGGYALDKNKKCYYREDGCQMRPWTQTYNGVSGDKSIEFNGVEYDADGKTIVQDETSVIESNFQQGQLKNTPLSNTWGQSFGSKDDYKDTNGSSLNRQGDGEYLPFVSLGLILTNNDDNIKDEIEKINSEEVRKKVERFYDLYKQNVLFDNNISIKVSGCASVDGNSNDKKLRNNRNFYLAYGRAYMLKQWLKCFFDETDENVTYEEYGCDFKETEKNNQLGDSNSTQSKLTRYASVKITVTVPAEYQKTTESGESETSKTEAQQQQEIAQKKEPKYERSENIEQRAYNRRETEAVNKIRYDQEYHFFKRLKREAPLTFDRLVQKLQYFDPAFHSMTPEGFNARLTFLQQCTRQGDTTTASDPNPSSANNLAFGRPPFCVLRLGDFYNQMIVINSIQLDYSESDGLHWDMNQEGIGLQPLLCRVTLNFNFIGGSDMSGPVRRLQNAMSFNYYANASLYDNRADRPYYDWHSDTGKSNLLPENSYAYSAQMFNSDVKPNEERANEYFMAGVTPYVEKSDYATMEKLKNGSITEESDKKRMRRKERKKIMEDVNL